MSDGFNQPGPPDQPGASGQPGGRAQDGSDSSSGRGWLRQFFWRYWGGGYRLAVSYWLVGWALQFVLLVLSVLVGAAVGALLASATLALVAITLLALAVATWVSVGLWRSATVYMQTSSRVWGVLAKISAVGSLVQVLVQIEALWVGR